MLSGDNGILQRAGEAKTSTEKAQVQERIQICYVSSLTNNNGVLDYDLLKAELTKEFGTEGTDWQITENTKNPWRVTVGEVTYDIDPGSAIVKIQLPSKLGTKPYFPGESFKQLPGTGLDEDTANGITAGLVVTDADDPTDSSHPGNEYVWIEVPSTYVDSTVTGGPNYSSVTGVDDYGHIELALRNYVSDVIAVGDSLGNRKTTTKGYVDEWYAWDTTNNKIIEHTTTDANEKLLANGCGLNYEDYYKYKHQMLTSIYTKGGFWIGRYEAGMTGNTGRENENLTIDGVVPLSKQDLIPVFYVTCSQAQIIATRAQNIDTKYKKSLMFGIQWDLVLKHLKNKGVATSPTNLLTGDSSSWGNYSDTTNATLRGGKYTQYMNSSYQNTFNTWYAYDVDLGSNIKNGVMLTNASMPQGILLTTGASNKFNQNNIYDLAGNLFEWTLEKNSDARNPCVVRGGVFSSNGDGNPVSDRWEYGPTGVSTYTYRFSYHFILGATRLKLYSLAA